MKDLHVKSFPLPPTPSSYYSVSLQKYLDLIWKLGESNWGDTADSTAFVCPELYLPWWADLLLLAVIIITGDRIKAE